MWWFINQNIRRRRYATNGRRGYSYSPFTLLNDMHRLHIKRYVENGWLPADYDPLKPETWPL